MPSSSLELSRERCMMIHTHTHRRVYESLRVHCTDHHRPPYHHHLCRCVCWEWPEDLWRSFVLDSGLSAIIAIIVVVVAIVRLSLVLDVLIVIDLLLAIVIDSFLGHVESLDSTLLHSSTERHVAHKLTERVSETSWRRRLVVVLQVVHGVVVGATSGGRSPREPQAVFDILCKQNHTLERYRVYASIRRSCHGIMISKCVHAKVAALHRGARSESVARAIRDLSTRASAIMLERARVHSRTSKRSRSNLHAERHVIVWQLECQMCEIGDARRDVVLGRWLDRWHSEWWLSSFDLMCIKERQPICRQRNSSSRGSIGGASHEWIAERCER